ncbi:hypothetical protein [Marinobacterium litorale]|uniref:hypothetical protein n=1 Tax=Marinobacterium litorale TaxID=404770 RepID=UPI0004822CFA|nr:hypothetical protein [Marinobacterium litorale]
MGYSIILVDAMKEAQGIPSDYKAAQALEVSRQFISAVRAGRKNLAPEQIVRAAKLAGIDPGVALMRRFKETIEDLETRQVMEEMEKKIAS